MENSLWCGVCVVCACMCVCMCVLCVRDINIQRCRHSPEHTHIHILIHRLMYVEVWNIMVLNPNVPGLNKHEHPRHCEREIMSRVGFLGTHYREEGKTHTLTHTHRHRHTHAYVNANRRMAFANRRMAFVHAYVHIHAHAHTQTHTYADTHIRTHTKPNSYVHTRTYTDTHIPRVHTRIDLSHGRFFARLPNFLELKPTLARLVSQPPPSFLMHEEERRLCGGCLMTVQSL